jgi:thiol-disulfide isomerase/thioredoxin
MDIQNARVVMMVFVMPGCEACHEHLPRLQRVQAQPRYQGVPVVMVDAADPRSAEYVIRYDVRHTPTTIVARRGPGYVKSVGSMTEPQIAALFETALRA